MNGRTKRLKRPAAFIKENYNAIMKGGLFIVFVSFGALLFFLSAKAYASHCPPGGYSDCAAAANTAKNPLVPLAGAAAGIIAAGLLGGGAGVRRRTSVPGVSPPPTAPPPSGPEQKVWVGGEAIEKLINAGAPTIKIGDKVYVPVPDNWTGTPKGVVGIGYTGTQTVDDGSGNTIEVLDPDNTAAVVEWTPPPGPTTRVTIPPGSDIATEMVNIGFPPPETVTIREGDRDVTYVRSPDNLPDNVNAIGHGTQTVTDPNTGEEVVVIRSDTPVVIDHWPPTPPPPIIDIGGPITGPEEEIPPVPGRPPPPETPPIDIPPEISGEPEEIPLAPSKPPPPLVLPPPLPPPGSSWNPAEIALIAGQIIGLVLIGVLTVAAAIAMATALGALVAAAVAAGLAAAGLLPGAAVPVVPTPTIPPPTPPPTPPSTPPGEAEGAVGDQALPDSQVPTSIDVQETPDSCAIACSRHMAQQLTGRTWTETELREASSRMMNGYQQHGGWGTTTKGVTDLLTNMGIHAEQTNLTIAEMQSALAEGKQVSISINEFGSNHRVVVSNVREVASVDTGWMGESQPEILREITYLDPATGQSVTRPETWVLANMNNGGTVVAQTLESWMRSL